MEVVGGIASIAAIIGLIGQIASGCNVVKNAIGDIKDAPKDILRISRHVNLVKAAADDVLRLHERVKQCLDTDDVLGENITECLEAVKALEAEILTSVTVFKTAAANQVSASFTRKSWKSVLHRLRYLTKKDDIEELIAWLDRTRGQVWIIQQKMALIFHLKEHTMLKDIGTFLNSTKESQKNDRRDTSEILATVRKTSNIIPSVEAIAARSSSILRESLEPSLEDLKASNLRILEKLDALPLIEFSPMSQFALANYINQAVEMHISRISQRSNIDCRKSTPVVQAYSLFSQVDSFKHKHKKKEDTRRSTANLRDITTRVPISGTYRYFRLLGISGYIQVLTHKYTTQFPKGSERLIESYRTTISVQARIPLMDQGYSVTYDGPSANFIRGCNIQLQVYGYHRWDSPYAVACRKSDILKMQQMYDEGSASPMDYFSLLRGDQFFGHLPCKVFSDFSFPKPTLSFEQSVESMKFWLSITPGNTRRSLNRLRITSGDLADDLSTSSGHLKEELLRLSLKNIFDDPLDWFEGPVYVETFDRIYDNGLRVLQEQGIYHINQDCHQSPYYPGMFFESVIQILNDLDGTAMQVALKKGLQYVPIVDGATIQKVTLLPAVFGILAVEYLNSTSLHLQDKKNLARLREGCANRISYIYKFCYESCSWLVSCKPLRHVIADGYYTPIDLARAVGAFATLDLGWRKAGYDVQYIVDREKYVGVSGLLSGSLQYKTRDECRMDFLDDVCGGHYLGICSLSEEKMVDLSLSLGIGDDLLQAWYLVNKALIQARACVERKTKTPGSWVDDEDLGLIAGEDFDIPWCTKHRYVGGYAPCTYFGRRHIQCSVESR